MLRSKMNKNNTLIIALIFFVSIFTIRINAQNPVNSNGSFEKSEITEEGDTSSVAGWFLGGPGFKIVDDTVKNGNHALEVTIDSLNGSNSWGVQAVNTPIPIEPGEYQIKVWYKSSQPGASLTLTPGNPSYEEFKRIGKDGSVGTEWEQISSSFIVPEGEDTLRVPIHFNYEENVGKKIYIDNLEIIPPKSKKPIIVEAEEDSIGNEFEIQSMDNGEQYISITTDYNETTGSTDYPGESRISSYEVSFPEEGDYDLFVRVRVGSGGYDDDSFFYGNGFGKKNPADTSDWIMVNGLNSAGFDANTAVVRGPGGIGSETWKWINLSRNSYQGEDSLKFVVSSDSLNRTFQIGAREDGLDIDKIAFGHSDLYFTVEALNNNGSGLKDDPRIEVPEYDHPIAYGKNKFLGNTPKIGSPEYFERYWNQATPGNAGKWNWIESTRDQMDWTDIDEAFNVAQQNDIPFRYHVLVWGNQQPSWINDLSQEEQLKEIKEWFKAVANRYGGNIDYLEVVNEPLSGHAQPSYKKALGGDGDTGWDWIIKSFELAHKYFPDSVMYMINDYNIVNSRRNTNKYLEIIRLLKERDLIDAIGAQGHDFATYNTSKDVIKGNLDKLGETGLPIQITELDIGGNPDNRDITKEESDQNQLERYKRIFPIFWTHPDVMGITIWGWKYGSTWRTEKEKYLLNSNNTERPAFKWLRNYVDSLEVVSSLKNNKIDKPKKFALHNNYPNPFNPTTNITFDIISRNPVKLTIYNIKGEKVKTLINNELSHGTHKVQWNGLNENGNKVSSGLYFYKLNSGSNVKTQKMMLLK